MAGLTDFIQWFIEMFLNVKVPKLSISDEGLIYQTFIVVSGSVLRQFYARRCNDVAFLVVFPIFIRNTHCRQH